MSKHWNYEDDHDWDDNVDYKSMGYVYWYGKYIPKERVDAIYNDSHIDEHNLAYTGINTAICVGILAIISSSIYGITKIASRIINKKNEENRGGLIKMKYVKKPVVIEAIQWDGTNLEEIKEFVGESLIYNINDAAWQVGKGAPRVLMQIKTLEGNHICSKGDYIIKGVKGEFYPCKPDIFEETYQKVDESEQEAERDYRDGIPGVHF